MIIKILLIYQCILVIKATNSKSEILLTQSVQNNGHHSNLQYSLELNSSLSHRNDCTLCIHQTLPSSLYVNSDELNELRRLNQLLACASEQIDVEKPEYLSEEINVYIYAAINSSIMLNLPIHLRYHSAKVDGGYEKVEIPKPLILIHCTTPSKEELTKFLLPCSACSDRYCNWTNHSYKDITSTPNILHMPVGNLQHYYIVVIVTLFVTCAGCVFISTLVLKGPNRKIINKKTK